MPTRKYCLAFLLPLVITGCSFLERQQTPNIATTPPYWQSQSQLAEMRAFHEKESAKMSEEVHIVRNREMERLETAGRELEKEQRWQESYERTVERRERWGNWFSRRNKGGAQASSHADGSSGNVR